MTCDDPVTAVLRPINAYRSAKSSMLAAFSQRLLLGRDRRHCLLDSTRVERIGVAPQGTIDPILQSESGGMHPYDIHRDERLSDYPGI